MCPKNCGRIAKLHRARGADPLPEPSLWAPGIASARQRRGARALVISEPGLSSDWHLWPVRHEADKDRAARGSVCPLRRPISTHACLRPPHSPAPSDRHFRQAQPARARSSACWWRCPCRLGCAGPERGTLGKMEWQMLKRLHRQKKVHHAVTSRSCVARSLRLEIDWRVRLLWRQKLLHPPSSA